MNKRNITNLLFAVSFVIFVFGSGYKLGELQGVKNQSSKYSPLNTFKPSSKDKDLQNKNFDIYWQTYEILTEKYIDKKRIDPQKMLYGSIKGMVDTLDDQYTFFLTPEENKQIKDDLGGFFEGIGAQLGLKNKRIVIIAPLKNSPAERAGVRAGDYINKVDGAQTKDWTLIKAVSKIRGKKGTKVTLTIERGGKESNISIIRDSIKVDSVELSFETVKRLPNAKEECKQNCPQYAYLKLNQFGENTNEEWDKAISQIKPLWDRKQIAGVVLDVRDNPGGFLDGSVYLASEFLSEDKLIVTQESSTSEAKKYYPTKRGELQDIPLVVIINKGSASASEILSGTLQQYKRAVVVGEKSFGKGSVQEALDLREGAGLHVTVAKWILPNGKWINGKGIEPDIKVENKNDDKNTLTKDKDQQLVKAAETLLK